MKKLLFVLLSVILLASCSKGVQSNGNVSASPIVTVTEITQTPLPTADLPSPSPTQGFVSCKQGERVSEYFYTGDLEKFFTLTSEELCKLLGRGFESSSESWDEVYSYSGYGVSFEYDLITDDKNIVLDWSDEEDLTTSLHNIVLSDFDFKGLSKLSSFYNVINTFGEIDLLTIYGKDNNGEGYFYYALRYIIGNLRFEFSSPDETGAGGLMLTITSSSDPQVFYKSCGEGDSVSPALTTGDIKKFLKLSPEALDGITGNGSSNFNEDTGNYSIYFDYLGAGFAYELEEASQEELYIISPGALEYVWINDFNYLGLNNASTFKDVKSKLGKAKVVEVPIEDTSYFALYYKIDGMQFEFSGSDEQASDGVNLCIYPVN